MMTIFSRFHFIGLQSIVPFKTEVSYIWIHYQ